MKKFNFKSAPKSYSNAVKINTYENQWYKKFGSFLISIVNGRKDFLHSCGVVGLSLVLVSNASPVQAEPAINALPTGYQSVAGNIEFNQTANTLNVSTGANNSIANYQSFNVGQNATVNFNLPSSQSAILNRVTGKDFA